MAERIEESLAPQVTNYACQECGQIVTGRTYHTYLHCLVWIHEQTDRKLTRAQIDSLVLYAKDGPTWTGK